jgi:general stress protein YciG
MANDNRGFAAMKKQGREEEVRQIASKGGHSQGKMNNPGNFANDRAKARRAGEKGGERSHRND